MAVFKREGSPFWFIAFTFRRHGRVRQSSGITTRDLREDMGLIISRNVELLGTGYPHVGKRL